MIVTTKQVAEVFGVTDRAVRLWTEKGCPKLKHGKWDLKEVLNWWLENLYRIEEDSEALAEAKLEYWKAKARTEKVKADLAEEAVIKIDDFKDAWVWRIAEMSNGLRAIPLRVTSLLVGKPEKEIQSVLENEFWQILTKFARDGRFTPKPETLPSKAKWKAGARA